MRIKILKKQMMLVKQQSKRRQSVSFVNKILEKIQENRGEGVG